MPDTLAQKVKAKYPGVYDDIPDAELEAKVIAKYPGVYDDLPRTTASAQAETPKGAPSMLDAATQAVRTVTRGITEPMIGAAKGGASTVFGLGKIAHDYTPIGKVSDAIMPGAFDKKPAALEPSNPLQSAGYTAEQMAEFFVPVAGVTGKVARAAEAGKAAGLTLAQGGSPTAAGLSGLITAAIPGGGAMRKAGAALKESAVETMANSLRATKEWAKLESEKLAPEMLKRGVGGSIKTLRKRAGETATRVGKNLHDAYEAAAAAGETVPGPVIRGNIQLASDSLHTVAGNGKRIAVPGNAAAIAQLNKLDEFVEKLSPDIPVNQAAAIKRQFDDIVERAGLFGPNAMASASDKSQGWAFKKASDSFRELLNTNPTIEALNQEYSFWAGLRNVTEATKNRKVGQTGGLIASVAGAAGAGAMGGDSTSDRVQNAIIGGVVGRQMARLLQSPQWMNQVSAPMKNALAGALAGGGTGEIMAAINRILASLPARTAPAATGAASAAPAQ